MSPSTKFAEGELINVQIRGARVVQVDSPDSDPLLSLTAGIYSFEVPTMAPGVTVERVAPAQWPPQRRDRWKSDGNGWEWFAVESDSGVISLVNEYGDSYDPRWAAENVGPMRLVSRDGWTPATETTPAEAGPVDKRAAFVANLRALADLLEQRTDLPVPDSCRAQYSIFASDVPDYADRLAEVRRVATAFGGDDRENGSTYVYFGRKYSSGTVEYIAHAEAPPAATQPDEPAEDDQADADPEAPVPAPAAAPSIDDDAFDATCGPMPPAGRLFEDTLKSPAEWLTEYPGTQILDWDGWHDKDITEPISHAEFHQRLMQCTITGPAKLPHRAPDPDAASLLAQSLDAGARCVVSAPVTGNVICGSLAASCVCGLTPGHEGPHECARPSCGGSWRGEMKGSDFEVIRFPDISAVFGGDL